MAYGDKETGKGKLLIVDDVETNRMILEEIIKNMGCDPVLAENGEQALELVKEHDLRLILTDISMPGIDGYELCRILKRNERTRDIPIVFISAFDNPEDIVEGFRLGGADYITKPFNMKILLRRVEVAIRRGSALAEPSAVGECYRDDFLQVDFTALTAVRGGEKLAITPNEYKLLKILTANAGNVVTRQSLLTRLWDCNGNFIDDHTLTVTMNRLRAKIEDEEHAYIKTVRGMGYVWQKKQGM